MDLFKKYTLSELFTTWIKQKDAEEVENTSENEKVD